MKIASPLTTEPAPILQWIEIASSLQIPGFHIIGLAAPEVSEARERVRAAIDAAKLGFPKRRLVLNLSPASIRKRGTGSDLGMALAILLSQLEVAPDPVESVVACGELGLDGQIKSVGQVMRSLYASWKAGAQVVLMAEEDERLGRRYLDLLGRADEFSSPRPRLIAVSNLSDAWEKILSLGEKESESPEANLPLANTSLAENSAESKSGSETNILLPMEAALERAVCVAAAGHHHLLLLGPRGVGKSHALEWFARLQPPASARTQVHHLLIRELMGRQEREIPGNLPIRRVGSQTRSAALCGSASPTGIRPGEFSLAHGGILMADEFPEWSRDSREAFREPLERGRITLTRVHGAVELPASFTLVANGNLCPCGGWPQSIPKTGRASSRSAIPAPCICAPLHAKTYLDRLSGPILDRLDLCALILDTPNKREEKSDSVDRLVTWVNQAHELAVSLWGAPAGRLSGQDLEGLIKTRRDWEKSLDEQNVVSLRSRHKVLRVALTLGIWEYLSGNSPSPEPQAASFSEAFYFRPEGLKLFH